MPKLIVDAVLVRARGGTHVALAMGSAHTIEEALELLNKHGCYGYPPLETTEEWWPIALCHHDLSRLDVQPPGWQQFRPVYHGKRVVGLLMDSTYILQGGLEWQ